MFPIKEFTLTLIGIDLWYSRWLSSLLWLCCRALCIIPFCVYRVGLWFVMDSIRFWVFGLPKCRGEGVFEASFPFCERS